MNITMNIFEVIKQGRDKAIPQLIEMLYHDDASTQEIAIGFLWGFFRENVYTHPNLLSGLVYAITMNLDNNPLVIIDGTGFLADLKDEKALALLLMFLKSDNVELREGSVDALGMLKDARAVPYLKPLLADEDKLVQNRVIWALRHIGTVEALLETDGYTDP